MVQSPLESPPVMSLKFPIVRYQTEPNSTACWKQGFRRPLSVSGRVTAVFGERDPHQEGGFNVGADWGKSCIHTAFLRRKHFFFPLTLQFQLISRFHEVKT